MDPAIIFVTDFSEKIAPVPFWTLLDRIAHEAGFLPPKAFHHGPPGGQWTRSVEPKGQLLRASVQGGCLGFSYWQRFPLIIPRAWDDWLNIMCLEVTVVFRDDEPTAIGSLHIETGIPGGRILCWKEAVLGPGLEIAQKWFLTQFTILQRGMLEIHRTFRARETIADVSDFPDIPLFCHFAGDAVVKWFEVPAYPEEIQVRDLADWYVFLDDGRRSRGDEPLTSPAVLK